jgi:bifunctional non-homologous end joining protein LigD
MSLDEYQRKRDFTLTAEPATRLGATATGRSFVVQKHAARQLHYDFRLELDGVLKSWSVPKGPSCDPASKRLAVAVEDHPIDYAEFEGIIPAGQYGGGTVLLWDRGTWQPLADPVAALAKGHLKFELVGEKLRGRWALVRLKPRRGGNDQRSWLLVKDRDAHARPEAEWSVTEARPESVATGRDLEAIASASDRVWHSARTAADPSALADAHLAAMPSWIRPAQSRRAPTVPEGDDWLHELEIVGERVSVRIDGGHVQLCGSDRRDRSRALDPVAAAARALPVHQAIVDGVATALGADGHSGAERPADTLYAFDLLYLDGYDLTKVALDQRKRLLSSLVARATGRQGAGGLRYADHVEGRGREVFAEACALGARGVVSKRKGSIYPPATSAWRMVRCPASQAGPHASAATSAPRSSGKGTAAGTRVAGVKLTHPERMLYAEAGLTKLDLACFYERVAERMLPYLADRPLTLVRAPDGIAGHRFFVRHAGDWAPRELRQLAIEGGAGTTMIVDDVRGLIALAQMNVLEVHPWNARTSALEQPDRLVFDLDPGPEVPWSDVVDGARRVRDVLATLELASFVKTTGGKGLHVVVPLVPAATWEEALDFSHTLAQALERFEPTRFSAGLAKAGRTRKIFVDYLRNRRGATAVSAYSSRAHALATVSVPVAWEDLGFGTRSDAFHVGDVDRWLGDRDPWAEYGKTRQRLSAATIRAAHAALLRAPSARSSARG